MKCYVCIIYVSMKTISYFYINSQCLIWLPKKRREGFFFKIISNWIVIIVTDGIVRLESPLSPSSRGFETNPLEVPRQNGGHHHHQHHHHHHHHHHQSRSHSKKTPSTTMTTLTSQSRRCHDYVTSLSPGASQHQYTNLSVVMMQPPPR